MARFWLTCVCSVVLIAGGGGCGGSASVAPPAARLAFDFHSTVDRPGFNRDARQALADATAEYERLYPRTDAKKPTVTIYANRREWAEDAARREGADVYLQIDRGGFADGDEAVLQFVGIDTLRLMRHEAFHAWLAAHARTRPPPFVEEGLAAWMEAPWKTNSRRLALLREAPPPELAVLLTQSADEQVGDAIAAQTWYAYGWAFADYLLRNDRAAIAENDWTVARHERAFLEHLERLTDGE